MALPATAVWEVRTTGNDANGGGFSSARSGTDYSQQDAAQLSLTDLACEQNTTLTSATGGFTAAMVGNIIQIASGTNALAGFYEVTAYTSTNQVTIDRTCATGGNMTSGVGKLGGALETPGKCLSGLAAGNTVWVKSGTYYFTDTWTMNVQSFWRGYGSTRADTGTATFSCNSASKTIFNATPNYTRVEQFVFTFDGTTGIGFNNNGSYVDVRACKFENCRCQHTGPGVVGQCEATGSYSAAAFYGSNCSFVDCIGHNLAAIAFQTVGVGARFIRCIAASVTTGANEAAFYVPQHNTYLRDCVVYECNRHGYWLGTGNSYQLLQNCIAAKCSQYGFYASSANTFAKLDACVGYNNTSGNYANIESEGFVALTADGGDTDCENLFVDAEGNDFRLTRTAGYGAVLRAAGIKVPLQTSYPDIGAVQHGDTTVPAVADVQSGVTFGDGAALTGTFTAPAVGDVQESVTYGGGGTEYTGTFAVPAEEDVEDGVTYGAGGTEFEGTLAGGGNVIVIED